MSPNIEKSGFHKGEYVGYANGVWRIQKNEYGAWVAVKRDGWVRVSGKTLKEISEKIVKA